MSAIFSSPNPILHVDIPAGQAEGDYKYTIAYPNDTTAIVAPLDPIIIIEGESGFNLKSSNSTTIIAAVVAFISGVAATMIFKG